MGLFKPKPHERRDEGTVLTLPEWPSDAVDDVDDDAFAAAIAAAREADAQAADAARDAEFAVSA